MNAWLGLADNQIVCYNAAGEAIGDYEQVAAERQAESMARVAAEQRAEATETRLRELEATVRRLQQGE